MRGSLIIICDHPVGEIEDHVRHFGVEPGFKQCKRAWGWPIGFDAVPAFQLFFEDRFELPL